MFDIFLTQFIRENKVKPEGIRDNEDYLCRDIETKALVTTVNSYWTTSGQTVTLRRYTNLFLCLHLSL